MSVYCTEIFDWRVGMQSLSGSSSGDSKNGMPIPLEFRTRQILAGTPLSSTITSHWRLFLFWYVKKITSINTKITIFVSHST